MHSQITDKDQLDRHGTDRAGNSASRWTDFLDGQWPFHVPTKDNKEVYTKTMAPSLTAFCTAGLESTWAALELWSKDKKVAIAHNDEIGLLSAASYSRQAAPNGNAANAMAAGAAQLLRGTTMPLAPPSEMRTGTRSPRRQAFPRSSFHLGRAAAVPTSIPRRAFRAITFKPPAGWCRRGIPAVISLVASQFTFLAEKSPISLRCDVATSLRSDASASVAARNEATSGTVSYSMLR